MKLKVESLVVEFDPERGMNFTSYRKGDQEVIDQTTRPLFEARCAGLGAMIGPHFHHRKGVEPEPFSHGIGRYAPWTVEGASETRVEAVLKGSDEWKGKTLKELEGQDFTMRYTAELAPDGLTIELSVVSDTDSVVGLHTYYAFGGGRIRARVQDHYNDQGVMKPIPREWGYGDDHWLDYALIRDTDFGFRPYPDPLHGEIVIDDVVRVTYESPNEENQWQLWHPKGSSFVCVEPLSAKDPRSPHLSVSSIRIHIAVL